MSKNKITPEKKVEKEVLSYCQEMGWFVTVVESKAVFSKALGIYRAGMTKKGFPDLIGCDNNGYVLAIELKAPGRLSTLRHEQKVFLDEIKSRGGFSAVVSNAQMLHDLYMDFLERKRFAK